MDGGNWRGEAWPGPEARARQRLPRVEDLTPAEQGYDREKVREAFDSFYRHIAQLDSTLRALEAVEVFRDQAGELRKELRALKVAGWTQQPWPAPASGRVSAGIPEALPRFAIEAAFLIVVAVVVAVAGFDRLSIVLVMALAWAIVGVVEWAASRERFARVRVPPPVRAAEVPAPAPLRVVTPEPPALAPAESWEAPAPAGEPDDDERTIIRAADVEVVAEPVDATPGRDQEPALELESEPPVELEPAAEADVASEPLPELEPAAEADVVSEPLPEVEPAAEADVVSEPPLELPAPAEPSASEPEPEPVAAPDADEAPAAAEPEPDELEPDLAPSRWSWAADSAIERARQRELADHPPAPKRRFWQRRKRDQDGVRFDAAQPRHVRVLPPEPSFDEQFPVEPHAVDPWERDLDLSIEDPEGSVDGDAEPAREPEAALDRGERS